MTLSKVCKYSALVIGGILVLFLLLMAGDTFETGISWYNIAGFFIQSIPALLIAATLILGYFRSKTGSVVFLIIAAAFTIYFHTYRDALIFAIISFPPVLLAILFFLSSVKEKQSGNDH